MQKRLVSNAKECEQDSRQIHAEREFARARIQVRIQRYPDRAEDALREHDRRNGWLMRGPGAGDDQEQEIGRDNSEEQNPGQVSRYLRLAKRVTAPGQRTPQAVQADRGQE